MRRSRRKLPLTAISSATAACRSIPLQFAALQHHFPFQTRLQG